MDLSEESAMICSNCRYWTRGVVRTTNPFNAATYAERHLGGCACPKFRFGYGIEQHNIAPDEVLIEDDEGWGIMTGEDFGCIHHEAIEVP